MFNEKMEIGSKKAVKNDFLDDEFLSNYLVKQVADLQSSNQQGARAKALEFSEKIKSIEDDRAVEKTDEPKDVYKEYENALRSVLPEGFSLKEIAHTQATSKNWRGDDPLKTILLLSDKNAALNISSEFPNVAHSWTTSLSHGVDKAEQEDVFIPFAIAIGFKEPKDWEIKSSEGSNTYQDVILSVDGKIKFSDVSQIALRVSGKDRGKPLPPKFYNIVKTEK
jgi:hypothetical protein